MILRRSKRNDGYTLIPRALAEDTSLSIDARGLLLYLLVKPDDWSVHPKDLQQRCGIGRGKTYGILRQLIAAGYIKRDQGRDHHGRLTAGSYLVFDLPQEAASPRDGLRDTAERYTAERDTVNRHAYQELTVPTTKNQPKTKPTKNVAAAGRPAHQPADPSAAQDDSGGDVDDALTVACVQAMTGREGDDLATYAPRTVREARTAARRIVQGWEDVTPEDIQTAAAAWVERLGRIRKGGHVDPPRGPQLVEAVADWSTAKTEAALYKRRLVPFVRY